MPIKISFGGVLSDAEIANIKAAIESQLTPAVDGQSLEAGVRMDDGFVKPVKYKAQDKGTYWQVTIHTIG